MLQPQDYPFACTQSEPNVLDGSGVPEQMKNEKFFTILEFVTWPALCFYTLL